MPEEGRRGNNQGSTEDYGARFETLVLGASTALHCVAFRCLVPPLIFFSFAKERRIAGPVVRLFGSARRGATVSFVGIE